MTNVLPFRSRKNPSPVEPENPPDTVQGLIEIKSTSKGDVIRVTGAYADRLQYGVFALTKLLGTFVDKIAASKDPGYSTAPPVLERLPRRRGLPPRFLEKSSFADLDDQKHAAN